MSIEYKLTEQAKNLQLSLGINLTPRRVQEGDAGFDLSACIPTAIRIFPGQVVKIPTGVCVWLGDDFVESSDNIATLAGLYLPRSSNSGLVLENTVGLLDSAYQGESFCKWRNRSEEIITISPGDRMVQLVVFPAIILPWNKVEEFTEKTSRGLGDGSSGK